MKTLANYRIYTLTEGCKNDPVQCQYGAFRVPGSSVGAFFFAKPAKSGPCSVIKSINFFYIDNTAKDTTRRNARFFYIFILTM
jgi:hypothetical protein